MRQLKQVSVPDYLVCPNKVVPSFSLFQGYSWIRAPQIKTYFMIKLIITNSNPLKVTAECHLSFAASFKFFHH
ncbi:hypothetical protein TNCT_465331 [Trichonephila clavata]|uniref:Uncharacterized protein n=1 Tax=Trichonephila clavata TaxID=2740835 RepID=A0A8X6HHV5_TRICU|nr:hypothetical protein TNCT_465331 [Trichonephila clavata]